MTKGGTRKLDYLAKDRVTRDALLVAEGDTGRAVELLEQWGCAAQAEALHTASAGAHARVRTRKGQAGGAT